MDTVLFIVVLTLIAGVVGTGVGGILGAVLDRDSDRIASLLLSFAGGIMLAVVCFDLILEALQPENVDGQMSVVLVVGGILLGYGVICLLNYIIDKSTNHEIAHIDEDHPRTADALDELIHADHYEVHKKTNTSLFIAGLVMACAIALHNLPEGMVIGASYASETGKHVLSGGGFILAVVIGLHNIPEGMAVSVPLISGGMGRIKAVLITALTGFPTVLGALLGYWLGMIGPIWLSLSLSFASGAMLYVVFGELLPEAILMWRSKLPAFSTLAGILVGMLLIF
jgi:ZIP family zinc transporter